MRSVQRVVVIRVGTMGVIVGMMVYVLFNAIPAFAGPNTDTIYWAESTDKRIARSKGDGSQLNRNFIAGFNLRPQNLSLDVTGGKIYWDAHNAGVDGVIQRNNLDGSGSVETLIDPPGAARVSDHVIDVPNNKIYWTDTRNVITSGPYEIYRANLSDGTGETSIISRTLETRTLAFDQINSRIYWIETDTVGDKDYIYRANTNGTGTTLIYTLNTGALALGTDILVDNAHNKIFWVEEQTGTINAALKKADLDGSNIENVLASGSGYFPHGLGLDLLNDVIYWSDTVNPIADVGGIYRSNLDGSGITLVTGGLGVGNARGAAVILNPELPPGVLGYLFFFLSGLIVWLKNKFSK